MIGKLIADVWLTMLAEPAIDQEMRRQALRHSILAEVGNDRFFEAHGGTLRVGHRRWKVNDKGVKHV